MSTKVLGFDVGCQKSVLAWADADAPGRADLVLNDLANLSTPAYVSFTARERFSGEQALNLWGTNHKNTVTAIPKLLSMSLEELEKGEIPGIDSLKVQFSASEMGDVLCDFDYKLPGNTNNIQLTPSHLYAILLASLRGYAEHNMKESFDKAVITYPSYFNSKAIQALRESMEIARITPVAIVSQLGAASCNYGLKNFASLSVDGAPRKTLFLDVGHGVCSVLLGKFKRGNSEGSGVEDCVEIDILVDKCNDELGSVVLDELLFKHFAEQCRSHKKHPVDVVKKSKAGQRLMVQCEKAKKILSANPEMRFVLECLVDDNDFDFHITRVQFEALCHEYIFKFKEFLKTLFSESSDVMTDIDAVELLGGGTRIPVLQKTIEETMGDTPVRRTLDSTSCVSMGAAALAASLMSHSKKCVKRTVVKLCEGAFQSLTSSEGPSKTLKASIELESLLKVQDEKSKARSERKNSLESFLIETRSNCFNSPHGALLDKPEVREALDSVEDWFYGEGDDADAEEYVAKLEEVRTTIAEKAPEYDAKIKEEKEKKAMLEEANRLKWEEERKQEANSEDHDTRKLKKEDRMRLVLRNKEEATELFKDGNYEHAAQRYIKSLTHTDKFFDIADSDKAEIDNVRKSLYLNLSMCFLKLSKWTKVIENCKSALEIDPACGKAYYRSAQALERLKKYNEALKDISLAEKYVQGDSAILKLKSRIEISLKKQVAAEKKMYGKMFG
eukprot:Nk52_evm74s207 gene=Nk52_evmTU74s207